MYFARIYTRNRELFKISGVAAFLVYGTVAEPLDPARKDRMETKGENMHPRFLQWMKWYHTNYVVGR